MATRTSDDSLSREEYIERHLPFNLLAFLTDAAGWWLGMSFFSAETILPYFVRELGGSNLLVGCIPALFSLGFNLPQVFVAHLTERRRYQKYAVLKQALIERLPIGVLAVLTYFLAGPVPNLLLILFFLMIGMNAFMMGVTTPGYSTLLTKTIPPNKRGRLWGVSLAVGGVIGFGGAKLSGWLLEDYGMPQGFALCYLIGFIVLVVSVLPLGYVREPESLNPPKGVSLIAHWKDARGLLSRYPGFRRLLICEIFFSMAAMASAFYTVYAQEMLGADGGWVGNFTMAMLAAGAVGGFAWGSLSDRHGNRQTLIYSAILTAIAPLLALTMPNLSLFLLVFIVGGLARTGFELANFNIVLEYAGEEKVATFQGVRALVVMWARMGFPLIGGVIAEYLGYSALFWIAAIASLGVFWMLRGISDPRHDNVSPVLDERATGV